MAFFEKNKKLTLRPFGTGSSCYNTIYNECIRDIPIEECIEHCDKSKYCNFGLHVEGDEKNKSYCLPLNTSIVANRNIKKNLIYNKNKTPLSNRTTFFYDKRYFDMEQEIPEYLLFSDDLIKLELNEKGKEKKYLNINLFFSNEPSEPFLVIYFPRETTSIYRIVNNELLGFHYFLNFANIAFDPKTKKAEWKVYSPETQTQQSLIYSINPDNVFIDEGEPFELKVKIDNEEYYWGFDESYNLIAQKEKPNFWFTIKKIKKEKEVFFQENTENMQEYLNKNFNKNVYSFKSINNLYSYLFLIFILLIFSLFFLYHL